MSDRTGLSRGDRNRNARLARLRQLPAGHAIVGIDLAADKQAAVVTDHDSRARYSLTEPAVQLVPVFAQLGSWGLRHRPTSSALNARAELLEQGGPALWQEFMDELPREHLGSKCPARSPSVRERLNAAYHTATSSS